MMKGCAPCVPKFIGPRGKVVTGFPIGPKPESCPFCGDAAMKRPVGDAGPIIISIVSPLIRPPLGMSIGMTPLGSCIPGGKFPYGYGACVVGLWTGLVTLPGAALLGTAVRTPRGFLEYDKRIPPPLTRPLRVLPYSSLRAFDALDTSSN